MDCLGRRELPPEAYPDAPKVTVATGNSPRIFEVLPGNSTQENTGHPIGHEIAAWDGLLPFATFRPTTGFINYLLLMKWIDQ